MRSKVLTLAATGVVGLALGAGLGVAAAQTSGGEDTPPVSTPASRYESMDEMHAVMREQMPAGLVEECDVMHASMPETMRSMDPGSMGSMMGGPLTDGWMADQHDQHHR